MDANPGYIYRWEMSILRVTSGSLLHIGIIEASKVPTDKLWWGTAYGYSIFQDGDICHNGSFGPYAPEFETNDIVKMCLDLKDKYELSFNVKGKDCGTAFDVKQDTTYKLGVAMQRGKVGLESFKIE